MNLSSLLLRTALGVALLFPATVVRAAAQDDPATVAAAPADPQAKTLYWSGHAALASGDFNLAAQRFRQLERDLRRASAAGVDAAVYWQAYALDAGKRRREAARLALRLEREFPDSSWRRSAQTFLSAADAAAAPDRDREADALMALDALMMGGNAKAVPTLQRVLSSDHSDRVKTRALFVLTQIDERAAHAALDSILSSNSSLRLKREAVQQIAIGGNAESLEKLVALYPKTEASLRHAILNAYMLADRGDLLGQVARSETDPELQMQAIQLLGAQGEKAALRSLLDTVRDPQVRQAAIEAMGISGDAVGLGELMQSSTDPETQKAALHALAISGAEGAREAIVATYRQTTAEDVREAAIQALMIADDGEGLLALYREATTRKQKQAVLQALTVADPDRALQLVDEQL